MSLINDALKKAKQAQENAPARESAPQLRSPETDHPVRTGPSLMLPAIVVAAGLVGATLIWMAMANKRDEKRPELVATLQPPATPKPATAVAPKPEGTVATPPVPTPAAQIVSTPPAVPALPPPESNPAAPAGDQAAVVVAAKPAPKLNGIFYNPTKPTAIVNNKLVSTGSRVGEFTVLAITQNSVTLAGGGQTNVLSLSE